MKGADDSIGTTQNHQELSTDTMQRRSDPVAKAHKQSCNRSTIDH